MSKWLLFVCVLFAPSTAWARRHPDDTTEVWLLVGMFVLLAGGMAWDRVFQRPPPDPEESPVDVGVIRIALDGRTRSLVQRELARIRAEGQGTTAAARAQMLREVATLLRRLREAWLYGGATNEPIRTQRESRVVFERHLHEVLARTDSAAPLARTDVPEGFGEAEPKLQGFAVVVTIVVATRTELVTVQQIASGDDLRYALESIGYRDGSDIVAVEVVLEPSEPGARMTLRELVGKYPPPVLRSIDRHGDVAYCTCGWPRPAALPACPQCNHRDANAFR